MGCFFQHILFLRAVTTPRTLKLTENVAARDPAALYTCDTYCLVFLRNRLLRTQVAYLPSSLHQLLAFLQ